MDEDNQDPAQQPIIIIKRNRGGHDEHHGGVWKIAFADFMTAMMAFFLVMWLINASNDETRSQVASYFNPVKLTDAVAGPKGVRSSEPFVEVEEHDDKNGQGGGAASKKGGGGSEGEEADSKAEKTSEQALFQDPYAVLVEIAGEKSSSSSPASTQEATGQGTGLAGGDAFRDPFDPAFWLQSDDAGEGPGDVGQPDRNPDIAMREMAEAAGVTLVEKTEKQLRIDEKAAETPTKMADAKAKPMKSAEAEAMKAPKAEKEMSAEAKTMQVSEAGKMKPEKASKNPASDAFEGMSSDSGKKMTAKTDDAMTAEKSAGAKPIELSQETTRDSKNSMQAAAELKAEIMAAAERTGPDRQPTLIVDQTAEGLVVSLTDDLDFGMFASASARPNSEMVRFMDRVASVLAKRPGRLIVRGHTDSRQFRSEAYDNWRLSTARAHMAYHMLVRGGVEMERFSKIEGHADRDPRNKSDTEAAENRRIEILLVRQGT